MTTITRAKLKTLRENMQRALNEAGLDFTFDVGNMTFGDTEVTIKVKAVLNGATPKSKADLEKKMKVYGLGYKGKKGQTLTGFNFRSPKYPFTFVTVRGARYKCSLEQAKAIFG